jgi:anti-sigma factor RsiW
MTQTHADQGCPAEVLDWIAWYPEGDLPEGVRGTVESHAAECSECRREIAALEGEAVTAPEALPEPDVIFGRVMDRVRANEALPRAAAQRAPRRAARVWSTSRRMALAAGIALVLVGGMAGVLGARALGPASEPVYRTVMTPEAIAPADVVQIDVVFRPEVPFGRIQEILRREGATVVAGPTRGGLMRLNLPSGSDADGAATRLRDEAGIALFAEPVRP